MRERCAIEKLRTTGGFSANPYRRILRKSFPEPIIALLAFVLGIWMWDHYFSVVVEYPVGTEQIALLKIDRDLRLADAMAGDLEWMQRLAGTGEPAEIQAEALLVLEKLEAMQTIGPRGIEAYTVIKAAMKDAPLLEGLERAGVSGAEDSADPNVTRGSWWRAKILQAREENGGRPGDWKGAYDRSLQTLRIRSLASAALIGTLALAGLFFLPLTFRGLASGLREKVRGYAGAWTPSLGLTVFIVGTLAWIGFIGALDYGIETLVSLPPVMGILLDTAARMLPALIAVGFLFKEPRHAMRVMGLNRRPQSEMVLGMFALLLLADGLMRLMLGGAGEIDPSGGLSLAEAGVQGLVFTVISACIVAPISEEILYRGVLFRSFQNKLGVLPAAVLSAVIFSMIHFYGLYGFLSVAVFGISCALLYAATGSLVSVILLHALYNFTIKIPEWIFYHAKIDW